MVHAVRVRSINLHPPVSFSVWARFTLRLLQPSTKCGNQSIDQTIIPLPPPHPDSHRLFSTIAVIIVVIYIMLYYILYYIIFCRHGIDMPQINEALRQPSTGVTISDEAAWELLYFSFF